MLRRTWGWTYGPCNCRCQGPGSDMGASINRKDSRAMLRRTWDWTFGPCNCRCQGPFMQDPCPWGLPQMGVSKKSGGPLYRPQIEGLSLSGHSQEGHRIYRNSQLQTESRGHLRTPRPPLRTSCWDLCDSSTTPKEHRNTRIHKWYMVNMIWYRVFGM